MFVPENGTVPTGEAAADAVKTRVVPFAPPMLDSSGRAMGTGRGKGIHLGDVLRYRREVLLGEKSGGGNEAFMQTGFVFEMFVEQALVKYLGYDASNLISPGEQELDGIFMNPDAYDTEAQVVYEYKCTWRSMKKLFNSDGTINADGFEKHFYAWAWQVASYCWVMGTRKARLVTFWVNGDYSFKAPSGGPQFRAIDLSFTDEELQANWRAILRDRDEMMAA